MDTLSLYTVGNVCQQLGQPFSHVRKAAERLQIVPAATFDHVPHYNERQVELLAEYFNKRRTKREAS
jgi:hypothetical protein